MQRLLLILIYKGLMPLLLRLVGVKTLRKTNFKEVKQFIIVANHNSHVDTMVLLSSLPTSQLMRTHPVATATYFGKKKWLELLSNLFVNTVLIQRREEKTPETDQGKALERLMKKLEQRHSLIFFPEGSRGEPEQMQAFRKGIGVLLQKFPQIPFIPVYLQGMGKILPKGSLLPVPYDAQVYFGDPTFCQHNTVEEIVAEVEREIVALKNRLS
jgi:1-acyl-sn-glycerol-3-phosphate acyltransferase